MTGRSKSKPAAARGKTPAHDERRQPGPLVHVTSGGIGVDYSARTLQILLSVGGTSELGDADVVGLAYGLQQHDELGMLPTVSLVCRNVTQAKKAWDAFETWQTETDGDAVSLSWFFYAEGYYQLVIGAEPERLRFRLRGFDDSDDDLIMSGYFKKRFDRISKPTEEFRAYLRKRYSPYLFSACTESMTPIGMPILKFHGVEADVNSLLPGSPERIILGLETAPERGSKRNVNGAKWRAKMVKTRFPVTLARLSRDEIAPLLQEASALGFQTWQIEQAAANLALSNELSPGRPHYASLQRSTAVEAIAAGIRGRREAADSSDFRSLLTLECLLKQLVLDANALLKSIGQQTTSSPAQAVIKLRKAGLLETGQRDA
jgi:hypothetical protein